MDCEYPIGFLYLVCKERERKHEKMEKFMAIGLAASMIIPSGVPQQILWASEFSAESSETVADVFGDNSESESGNRTGDKNNEKYEFDTGESEKNEGNGGYIRRREWIEKYYFK